LSNEPIPEKRIGTATIDCPKCGGNKMIQELEGNRMTLTCLNCRLGNTLVKTCEYCSHQYGTPRTYAEHLVKYHWNKCAPLIELGLKALQSSQPKPEDS
jgi:hypothetical protein